jgi:DNA invertase Pin-like site-specific DNA recombinase
MKQTRAALYVRVSTGEQNTEAQERALKDYVKRRGWTVLKIYRDKGMSGAKASRRGLDEMLSDCRRRQVDVVALWKFDRFARSLKNLIAGLELCRALGIDFVSVTEAIDTSLPAGEMLFQMIGAVAQFERSLIAERVRSGLANARANGKILGRPPLRKLTRSEIADLRRQGAHAEVPFRLLAKKFGVSVWTAHKLCQRVNRLTTEFAGEVAIFSPNYAQIRPKNSMKEPESSPGSAREESGSPHAVPNPEFCTVFSERMSISVGPHRLYAEGCPRGVYQTALGDEL